MLILLLLIELVTRKLIQKLMPKEELILYIVRPIPESKYLEFIHSLEQEDDFFSEYSDYEDANSHSSYSSPEPDVVEESLADSGYSTDELDSDSFSDSEDE